MSSVPHITAEPYPLTNAHCKTDWAKLHLDLLREAVDAFCADSHTIVTDEELEWDQVRYRIHLKQPHVSVYLTCGDFLQCLRTALDQAVWSLINHRTGKDSEDSQFPVFEQPLNANHRRAFNSQVKGLSDRAIEYIESIQPCNRQPGTPLLADPLWRIHHLNRIDKHRRISIHTQVDIAGWPHFGLEIPGLVIPEMSREQTDYGYDVLCRGSSKYLKPEISSVVVFGEFNEGISLDIDDLEQLHNFVTDEVLVALASRA